MINRIYKKFGIVLVAALGCLQPVLRAQDTELKYLSGKGSDDSVDWDFYCTEGMNSGKWTKIPVPSNWELQGFGKYDYGFAKDSVRGKEKGLYKYHFTVPSGWKGKKINIVFEGSMTDTEVRINGKSAGPIHQGAFYCFRYNITHLLKIGRENLLEVTVSKHSSNPSVNEAERKADYWIFGGIFRPVYLEALPQQHIENLAIDARADGSFRATVDVTGGNRVVVKLHDENGNPVGQTISTAVSAGTENLLQGRFSDIRLWSSEFPHLYKAVFTLYQGDKVLHRVEKKVGFRTIEVKQRDGVYINGVKIKFKGVNRHSFHPEYGRATSKAISIADVKLIKEMNMNAVRMSHYPPDGHFLDVCDSLGLYVMDELAGWHGHYDTPTGSKLLKEMMLHDRNHPSIVFWANGNEGGHNFDLDTLFDHYDLQKRPVVHPWQLFRGIETQHYREYNYGIGNYDQGREIVMPTEFLHGMYDGGHGAGLDDYWAAMLRNPLSAGGFLWDFADQGVVRRDRNDSIDTDGNRGADGIVGPYHEKEGSFFAIKEIWSPVVIERREITPDFDGRFVLHNRYHFTNTNQCSFSWKLVRYKELDTTIAESIAGPCAAPDIAPGASGNLFVKLPENWREFDVLLITIIDLYGNELFTWSYPIIKPEQILPLLTGKTVGRPELREEDSLYLVKVGDLSLKVTKNSGILQTVVRGDRVIPISEGPVLQEGVNNFRSFRAGYSGDTLVIESTFDRKESYNTLRWRVFPSGLVELKVCYFPAEYFTSFVGVNFKFPENKVRAVEYMGNGPYRVWRNRMKGNRFGVWHKTYNNTETGEFPFVYPEFKGYHSNMYWCRFITDDLPFTVATANEDVFFRLFTPAFKDDPWKNYQLVFPSGDISFLQGIPGIGSKTQRAETTGPMGGKNIFYDYEKDPTRWKELVLYFDFHGNNR